MAGARKRRWPWALLYLTVWTALGAFFAAQSYIDYTYARRPISWGQAAFLGLSEWYVWAAIFPVLPAWQMPDWKPLPRAHLYLPNEFFFLFLLCITFLDSIKHICMCHG